MDYSLLGSSVHAIFQARILEWVAMPSPEDLPNPGIEPTSLRSPALAGRFLTTSAAWYCLDLYYNLPPDYITFPTHQDGEHSSWSTSFLFFPFTWPSNKATLSCSSITLSPYSVWHWCAESQGFGNNLSFHRVVRPISKVGTLSLSDRRSFLISD